MQRGPKRRASGLSMHRPTRASRRAGDDGRLAMRSYRQRRRHLESCYRSRKTLTKRYINPPDGAIWASIASPGRVPGQRTQDARWIDPITLLQQHHRGLGGVPVIPRSGQPVATAAQLTLETLQVAIRVALHERLARPGRRGGAADTAGLVGRRYIRSRGSGRSARGGGPVAPRGRPGARTDEPDDVEPRFGLQVEDRRLSLRPEVTGTDQVVPAGAHLLLPGLELL